MTAPAGGPSDRELVLAFQAGSPEAYDEVYRRHNARVHGVCHRMLRNPQDAEEAVQETFLKAYQALPRFNGEFQLGAWLARIASNVCVDHLRLRSRSHLVALPADDMPESDRGPEEVIVGDHPRLDVALKDIQPLHAEALALRAVEGLSHREIAGKLSMTPPQVKALLHRARRSLKRAWDNVEGWVAAPLVATRGLFGRSEHASQAGPHLIAIGPQFPGLVEKVAASAVLVVVVLSGSTTLVPTTAGGLGSRAHLSKETRDVVKGSLESGEIRVAAPSAPTTEADEESATTLVDDVTETVTATIEGTAQVDSDRESDTNDGGGGGNDEVVPATVKSTTRQGKEAAVRTLESIAP